MYSNDNLYYMISWAALALSIILIVFGLFNATGLALSEKGFYMMSFTLSLFAAVTIQKNTRDEAQIRSLTASPAALSNDGANQATSQKSADDESGKSLFGTVKTRRDSGE